MKNQRLPFVIIIALLLVSSVVCTFPGIAKTTVTPSLEGESRGGNINGSGSISGNLSYPSDFIPQMRVVAIRIENSQPTGEFAWVETGRNAKTYTISGLTSGAYWVVAYPIENIGQSPSLAGGYTQAVVCGLEINCTDHSLIPVEVKDGGDTPGINPGDWNVPAGTFPKDPSQ